MASVVLGRPRSRRILAIIPLVPETNTGLYGTNNRDCRNADGSITWLLRMIGGGCMQHVTAIFARPLDKEVPRQCGFFAYQGYQRKNGK